MPIQLNLSVSSTPRIIWFNTHGSQGFTGKDTGANTMSPTPWVTQFKGEKASFRRYAIIKETTPDAPVVSVSDIPSNPYRLGFMARL